MWLEEPIGKRVNRERADEAVATGAKTVAVGCPFCSTMLRDGVDDAGREDVEVIDIAQLLARTQEKRAEAAAAAAVEQTAKRQGGTGFRGVRSALSLTGRSRRGAMPRIRLPGCRRRRRGCG